MADSTHCVKLIESFVDSSSTPAQQVHYSLTSIFEHHINLQFFFFFNCAIGDYLSCFYSQAASVDAIAALVKNDMLTLESLVGFLL